MSCAVGCSWMLVACATVDAGPDYARLDRHIQAATGVGSACQAASEDDHTQRVHRLLDHGLELREAVEVALLNNPGLQSAIHTIGMARADRVQAGLPSNPSLVLALRLPTSGASPVLESNLLGSLLDVWQLPRRIDTADAALQRRILEVAQGAVTLAAAVRAAYIDAVAAERLRGIAEDNRATAARLVALADKRIAARAATAIDADLARLDLDATGVALRDAQLVLSEARRTLATHLGLEALPPGCSLDGDFAGQRDPLPSAQRLAELTESRRLDLRAARYAVAEARAELASQRGRVVRLLDGGVDAEKDGEWTVGPAAQVELPLFDQNQARIARAAAALERRRQLLAELRLQALREVGSARARAEASRDAARSYSERILVRSRQLLELARQSYGAGKTTILPVLEAQRRLLAARREYVGRLQQAATALSDLERATGVSRETLLETSTKERP